jgi:hypothetical protein
MRLRLTKERDMTALDKLKRTILEHHGVKIERETEEALYVINKHGVRDVIAKTEVAFVDYMWGE